MIAELNVRKWQKKMRRSDYGLYDLNPFAGIPYQSPDCERDRVLHLHDCWGRNICLNMGKVNSIQLTE
jgi:hypothetical protein